MPYTAPDMATFTALFPAFAAVTQPQYDFWSDQAALITEPMEACLGERMDLATMLVTAHSLTLQGIGTGTDAQMAAQGSGSFSRIKSGTLELERGKNDAAEKMGAYGATSYGRRVYPMLRACVAGPLVTGTGAVVGGCGFNGFAGPLPPWQV